MSTGDGNGTREVERVLRNYGAVVESGDLERFLALWTPDGKQMPPGAPARVGLDQIRQATASVFEHFDMEMTVFPDEAHVEGETAYCHGNYDYAMKPKEGGEMVRREGKFLTILKRDNSGDWKIAVDCFNDNAPPTSA